MDEFSIIQKYFTRANERSDVILGIGDDCALLRPPPGQQLAMTTDSLVAGVHFSFDTSAEDIGFKAMAVNLSDLAAMGAKPAWISLALTLPEANELWLAGFSKGFFQLLEFYQLALVGGNLTHGPLSVTVQAFGFIPFGKGLLRSKASIGDYIYVTGMLGDAGLALLAQQKKVNLAPSELQKLLPKLQRPIPKVETGLQLRDYAHAAIDISDGLAADLNHILTASQVGACIWVEQLPLSTTLLATLNRDAAWNLALSAGDDYELCFTAPGYAKLNHLEAYRIGIIQAQAGLRLELANGEPYLLANDGYQHFKGCC